jgi:hypothetical protein
MSRDLEARVCLFHDNARPHTLEEFGWENLEHPSYSSDLASSDLHRQTDDDN